MQDHASVLGPFKMFQAPWNRQTEALTEATVIGTALAMHGRALSSLAELYSDPRKKKIEEHNPTKSSRLLLYLFGGHYVEYKARKHV